jgi:predicted phosphodiesterase
LAVFTKHLGDICKKKKVDRTYHIRKKSEICVGALDGEPEGKGAVRNTGIILK